MPTISARVALALLVCTGLAGCGGDANPVRDIAMAAGVTGGEPKPPPDFVSRSRREGGDFIPVGTNAPRRVYRSKQPGEVGTEESELDKARARNEAAGAVANARKSQ